MKHGIFAKAVLLEGESQGELDALLASYREHFQPVGAFEEDLVETLVVIRWRWRRLLVAERAEIQVATQFIEWDSYQRDLVQAGKIRQVSCNGGLIWKISNKEALARCHELLQELKDAVETDGFNPEADQAILTLLYGELDPKDWEENLFHRYCIWANLAKVLDAVREQNEIRSPEECKSTFIQELNDEIGKLERYRRQQSSIESDRTRPEKLRRSVPDSPRLDALLRYSTALERSFERTLNQLERAQRIRGGQSIPPPINLTLS